jgi:hypothetical protein
VPLSATLTWSTAAGANSYDVYLGSSNPPPLYSSDVTGTSLNVGPLTAGATYYWKVTAKNSSGTTDSAFFNFTVTQAAGVKKRLGQITSQ